MNKLRRHSNKGFTLVELIVVIVIIAILIAALTPAILGVIERANRAADEADARTLYSAAMVAADFTQQTPPSAADVKLEIAGGGTSIGITADFYFDGAAIIGVSVATGRTSAARLAADPIEIGDCSSSPAYTYS